MSLTQPKYRYLENLSKPIKGIGYYAFSASENIIHPSEAKKNSLFIFDDVTCDNQDVIREYFSMGRHNHIDSFYLIQTYAKVPKHLISDNANMLVLFKQDDLNLKDVYNNHIRSHWIILNVHVLSVGISLTDFYVFRKIINESSYRKGFDYYIHLE